MEPSIYGPYPYLPITQRKHFAWPNGNRLALWVIPNIEFFHLDDPMPGVNNERLPTAMIKIPNVRIAAMTDGVASFKNAPSSVATAKSAPVFISMMR